MPENLDDVRKSHGIPYDVQIIMKLRNIYAIQQPRGDYAVGAFGVNGEYVLLRMDKQLANQLLVSIAESWNMGADCEAQHKLTALREALKSILELESER